MKKFIGKAIQAVTKPFVAVFDFISQKNLFQFGLFAGGVIAFGFGLPALFGAISLASYAPFLVLATGLAIIPGALTIIGHFADKLSDFGSDLEQSATKHHNHEETKFAAVEQVVHQNKEEIKQAEGISKIQTKKALKLEKENNAKKYSVDELGY